METKNNLLGKASKFVMLRGWVFILFGLMAFFWTGTTLFVIVMAFGFFALIDGIILLAMHIKHHGTWGRPSLYLAICSILIGLYAIIFPSFTALFFAACVAIRVLMGGIFEIKMATHLRKHIAGETLLIFNGILSIIFGLVLVVLLIAHPIFGTLVLFEAIGIYAICLGILFVILSSRLKNFNKGQSKQISEAF